MFKSDPKCLPARPTSPLPPAFACWPPCPPKPKPPNPNHRFAPGRRATIFPCAKTHGPGPPAHQATILTQIATGTPAETDVPPLAAQNMPFGPHEAIMAKAAANGADSDFDLPAFKEALVDMLQNGKIVTPTLDGTREFSPIASEQLPIVIAFERLAAINRALLQNSRLKHDFPLPPWCSGHANDVGGAECIEAGHRCAADLDLGGLAVGVSCRDAFPEGLDAAHPLPGNGVRKP